MKIYHKLGFLLLCATSLNACGILSLLTCNFRIEQVTNPVLAGMNVSNLQDLTRLDAATALRVTSTLLSGSLPMSTTVHIGVHNPNTTLAKIAGLEWILLLEDVQVLSGATHQEVSVAPNGGTTSVPLAIQADLATLFKNDSREKMLQFANGLLHIGDQGAKVTLKIRPTLSLGGRSSTMGYITVSKDL